jgi:hypothetical protein
MFKAIKEFFFGKSQAAAPEAPYKVETPAFKPTADAAPAVTEVVTPVAPVKAVRKPRANVAAAKKPAAPKAE